MILDVGCGHAESHLARGHINIDIEKPKKKPSNFVKADAHFLPFKGNCFGKAYIFDVIEHLENPLQCLIEMQRVLKPNTSIEISTPNPLHWRKFLRVARGKKLDLSGKEHISTWTHIEMEILMEKAKFRNVKIHYTILPAIEKYDARKHIFADKSAHKILPPGISGRSMIIRASK